MANPFDRSLEIPVKLVSADGKHEIPRTAPLSAIPTERLRLLEQLYLSARKFPAAYANLNKGGFAMVDLERELSPLVAEYETTWWAQTSENPEG
jgi:hypothetical protein